MNEIIKFDYEGQHISFEFADGNKMINATEMAKPFKGKMVGDFLRLKNTQEYIQLIEERYGNSHIAPREVLRVVNCNLKKIPCPLHLAKEWGKIAVALSRQKSVPTGTAHDESYGQVRTYHEDVLKEVIG